MMTPTLVLDDGGAARGSSPAAQAPSGSPARSCRSSRASSGTSCPSPRRSRARASTSTARRSTSKAAGPTRVAAGARGGRASTSAAGPDRNLFFGGVSAVERRPDGSFGAAGDPRRGGHGVVIRVTTIRRAEPCDAAGLVAARGGGRSRARRLAPDDGHGRSVRRRAPLPPRDATAGRRGRLRRRRRRRDRRSSLGRPRSASVERARRRSRR